MGVGVGRAGHARGPSLSGRRARSLPDARRARPWRGRGEMHGLPISKQERRYLPSERVHARTGRLLRPPRRKSGPGHGAIVRLPVPCSGEPSSKVTC